MDITLKIFLFSLLIISIKSDFVIFEESVHLGESKSIYINALTTNDTKLYSYNDSENVWNLDTSNNIFLIIHNEKLLELKILNARESNTRTYRLISRNDTNTIYFNASDNYGILIKLQINPINCSINYIYNDFIYTSGMNCSVAIGDVKWSCIGELPNDLKYSEYNESNIRYYELNVKNLSMGLILSNSSCKIEMNYDNKTYSPPISLQSKIPFMNFTLTLNDKFNIMCPGKNNIIPYIGLYMSSNVNHLKLLIEQINKCSFNHPSLNGIDNIWERREICTRLIINTIQHNYCGVQYNYYIIYIIIFSLIGIVSLIWIIRCIIIKLKKTSIFLL